MAEIGHNAPIIKKVKKVKKVVGNAHHGGAWKVAYADFVTAMMAFFLLLWLLQVTTDDQKRGIADYFTPTAATISRTSGAGDILAGRTMSDAGAKIGEGGTPSVVVQLTPPAPSTERSEASEEDVEELAAAREQDAFDAALEAIKQALSDSPKLSELSQNLIMDMTGEGMRIQIVDQEGGSLFQSGSAVMNQRTRELIDQIAQVVSRLPNEVAISGHTDSSQFQRGDYSNWELSSDRANASRRQLVAAGVDPTRIVKVTGRADADPLVAEDPSLPENRRISIVLLRGASVLPPDLSR